jgi:phosphate-selective porin OprO/OprP
MSKYFKLTALAAVVGAGLSGAAWADTTETKGGFTIKTDDGRFSMNIGGRIHFDGVLLNPDSDSPFGSNTTAPVNFKDRSGVFFRRIYLTLKGSAYGWNYKIEPDFCGSGGTTTSTTTVSTPGPDGVTGTADDGKTTVVSAVSDDANTCREFNFQDIYLSTTLGPGELMFGQRKRYAGMEEITSSNEITVMERPFTTANGLFAGRDFQSGVFYSASWDHFTASGAGFSLSNARASVDSANGATRGWGYNARGTWAPLNADGNVVHFGTSYSSDKPQGGGSVAATVRYAGRLGPTQTLGASAFGANTWTLEAATAEGPFYAQLEYGHESFAQGSAPSDPGSVKAYSVMTSFFVTGETKPYNKKDGLFKSPKPNHDFGAVELVARYEQAKNSDNPAQCGANLLTPAVVATDCKVTDITVGANWYLNPSVRFMLNYIMGKDDRGAAGEDSPKALTARAQFSF